MNTVYVVKQKPTQQHHVPYQQCKREKIFLESQHSKREDIPREKTFLESQHSKRVNIVERVNILTCFAKKHIYQF